LYKLLLLSTVAATLLIGGESFLSPEKTEAFFGDKQLDRVVITDVENMKLAEPVSEVYTGHSITYTADKVAGKPKVYVVNRGSNAMDVISTKTHELTNTIPLEHFPRSAEQMNEIFGLCEASGMDKPMASIIDINTDKVVAVVGENSRVDTNNNPNFGGSHATGHPFWLDANHFVISDRYHRKVNTYFIEKDANGEWAAKQLNSIPVTTSVHQLVPSKGNYHGNLGYFYGTAEGAPGIYPSIIEFQLIPGKGLIQTRELTLQKNGVDVNSMWLHHGDFHPTQTLMYVGSGDGTLFIIDYVKMEIVRTIQAGKGAGHTVMVPQKNLAIVINHKDTFVTIVDLKTNQKIQDVRVSDHDEWVGKKTIQAHPKYHVSKDGNRFYAFLTEEGAMYEMDLNTLTVTRKLEVGGKPAQGAFVKK
jgi:DNA-binding beta-propeller fold protein YncE